MQSILMQLKWLVLETSETHQWTGSPGIFQLHADNIMIIPYSSAAVAAV